MSRRALFLPLASVVVVLGWAAAACVGEDVSPAPGGGDGSVTNPDGSTPGTDGAGEGDAGGNADAGTSDGGADGPAVDFCQSAAAAGAAFCVDFQTGGDIAAGWDAVNIYNGATITRNEAFGFQSTRSATVTLGGMNSAQATLSKTIAAGSAKNRVNIQYDGYWVFPSWPASSYNGFVTGIARTAAVGGSSQYYFDLERQPTDWKTTALTGTPVALPTAITPNVWHHIDMTYDASGPQAAVRISVDSTLVATMALTKGTPPAAAPTTFDQLILNAGAENLGAPVTTTQLTIDNLIVRFQ